MSGTIKILAIDGGGIRGIIPAMVLMRILRGRRAKDVFDLIAGTSTGGIIACGLCAPEPIAPQKLIDLYAEHGSEIFHRSLLGQIPGSDLLGPRYGAERLEQQLLRILGDTRLSEVDGVDMFVPSYAIELGKKRPDGETRAPLFFCNWRARGEMLPSDFTALEYDFRLRDVARATSAAPTYFPPAAIRNSANQTFGMIDGGVFANNPAMCALVAAHARYRRADDTGPDDRRFLVVSLGTGFLQRPIPLREAERWGLIGWARPVISVFMDGIADTVAYQLDELARGSGGHIRHFRFDIALGVHETNPHAVSDDFDDASQENIQAIRDKAQDLIDRDAALLDSVADLLEQD